MSTKILKQLSLLNQFVVYNIFFIFIALSTGYVPAWLGLGLPLLLSFLLVYVFRLASAYPHPRRKIGFYAGHILMGLATGLVILSVAVPVVVSTLADNSDYLILLFATIAAIVIAIPGWGIGTVLVWVCGTRRQTAVVSKDTPAISIILV